MTTLDGAAYRLTRFQLRLRFQRFQHRNMMTSQNPADYIIQYCSTPTLMGLAEEWEVPWQYLVPYVTATAGVLATVCWIIKQMTRDPDEAEDAIRDVKRRRSPDCALAILPNGKKDMWDYQWRRKLTPERYASLRKAECDPPNLPNEDGGIEGIMEDGIFECAGCRTPLYDNDFRFEAGSGWPCFYTCLPNAVRGHTSPPRVR
jgi:hypothetical protein